MRIDTTYIPRHEVFDYTIDGDIVRQARREVAAKTVVTKYYSFDDLNDDAKQRVKERLLEWREPWEFSDDVENDIDCIFGKGHSLKFQYSLSYCQGDGFNLYGHCTVKNVRNVLENAPRLYTGTINFTEKEWRALEHYERFVCSAIEVPMNTVHYCYSVANRLELANEWLSALKYDGYSGIKEDLLYKFERFLRELFSDIDSMYEEWGYEFFYELSDDDARETCDANNYEFNADGELI